MEWPVVEQDNNCNNMKKKIFIPTIGTLGDIKPYLILAQELKKRGHIVWIGVHKRFKDLAEVAGIDAVEIGGDLEVALSTTPDGVEFRRNPDTFNIGLLKRIVLPLMEEWFNGIVSGLKDADLIILSILCALPALNCLEKYPNTKAIGVYIAPAIRTAELAPAGFGASSESIFKWINLFKWKILDYSVSHVYNDKINQLRAKIDLPTVKLNYDDITRFVLKKPMLIATVYSKYLVPRPTDWREHELMIGPIIEEESNDFKPPNDVLEFLEKWKNDKIIYVGVGSMMSVMFEIDEQLQFLTTIQLAIKNNDCKAVISLVGFHHTNNNKLPMNENILYLAQNIPHVWLFPRISAAIHHGGAGTTHASLRFGLPTLILPFGLDQPFNGDRVFINKLGPKPIPLRQTNARNLTSAIHDLLNNYIVYKTNANKIGQLIKDENGLNRCIELIETELSA